MIPHSLSLITASAPVRESISAAAAATAEGTGTGAHAAAAGPTDLRLAVVAALVVVGTFFLCVGALGLLRFPDVYNRMHATSKATTLGAASLFLAGFVRFGPFGAGLTSLVGIAFLFVTAPTGAHLISRAARKLDVAAYRDEE
ncbi:Na(+) H(+) antiporter subunit G [Halarchaeum acidiphilum MH1-52-1]|uniref:Na(+) H(+) antiporter subunit G n=1 Tax=Halarchaeum acidiphilum MH1-52-1 TaxID=1261545 RepID=U2YSU0_9EURY|nr:Na(+) H(+) antiporter subunit G [Halarchaeum acidiphilum MH1-52-1]